MALEIAIGPARLTLNHGYSLMVTEQDGQITWPSSKGLYHRDTRMISSWRLFANGVAWDLLNAGNIAYCAARIYLANQPFPTESGDVPGGALGLVVSRSLEVGMHEDFDLVNHGQATVRFNLEVAIRGDFADLFEVKRRRVVRRGRIVTEWKPRPPRLVTTYENRDFRRELTIRIKNADSRPNYANGRISFPIELAPGAAWHACLLYEFEEGRAPSHCIGDWWSSRPAKRLTQWRSRALKIQTSNEEFYRYFHQAVEDMAALRLPIEGTGDLEFVPAAGVPWFVGLFGRDSLVVSLQNGLVFPDFARGALDVLGRYQAQERDDRRDAEPGKIMHELRLGELAHFKLIPHTPYYGTADATPLYLIVLHNAWRWTGDLDLVQRHLATAERCLEWIDRYGDRDGDGFQEYATRAPDGYRNQGWKDSGQAIVYPDGRLVPPPIALCELQGYVYDAWLRMAQIYDALDRKARAAELRAKARRLFEQFNDAFWDEASGFYALCLDDKKAPVFSVASNPGLCLWSGIVPPERAARVVGRLMAPDMWSGWGVRTLSADHAAYDPHSYQRGSVWPHDNGFLALGLRRYGFAAEAGEVARALSAAAGFFLQHQMPELYAGLARTPTTFPVLYRDANVPQAWAAGSCFSLLQAMLGVQPAAPEGRLYVDPALPDWMPDVTLKDMRLGGHTLDLRFWRDGPETHWEVLRGDPSLVAQRSCRLCPWADTPEPEANPATPSAPARATSP